MAVSVDKGPLLADISTETVTFVDKDATLPVQTTATAVSVAGSMSSPVQTLDTSTFVETCNGVLVNKEPFTLPVLVTQVVAQIRNGKLHVAAACDLNDTGIDQAAPVLLRVIG